MSVAGETDESAYVRQGSGFTRGLRRALHTPSLVAGVIIFGTIVVLALIAPLIAGNPLTQHPAQGLQGPSAHHLLGTDQLGRDVWARLLYAARIDLRTGVLAVLFPFFFGTLIGTIVGYFGGWTDTIVMRLVDIVVAFPFYVIVVTLVFVVGRGLTGIYFAIAVIGWVAYCRTMRSEVFVARQLGWVEAARGGGLSHARIILRHILPNTISQVFVYVTSDIVLVILAIVTLGYLGLGVPPPTPDWGTMINDGQSFLTTKWTLATIPGIAVVLTGLGLALLGDGFADLMRPE